MKLVKEKIDLKKNLYEKNNKLIQRSKKIFEIISFHFISNLFQDINGAGILPATHFDLLIRSIFLNLLRISFWQMKTRNQTVTNSAILVLLLQILENPRHHGRFIPVNGPGHRATSGKCDNGRFSGLCDQSTG